MNKDKREPEYPTELESQFILRLPEEPAKTLREILKTGDNLKNRLTIQIDNDMRHGEARLDHWLMHAKIVDIPTIIESMKTIDNKSFYKTADICQMMICKDEPDQPAAEEESPVKNKKKDPNKVDKKFLYPHGITPPTKNVRKRRFRKTLKKKYAEAPEIEKEVKRLLRTDNEADSVSWEIIKEDDEHPKPEPIAPVSVKPEKKPKAERAPKRESVPDVINPESSNVDDIFGGAVSDSDLEDDNINVELEDSRLSAYDSRLSDTSSMDPHGLDMQNKKETLPIEFGSHMFQSPHSSQHSKYASQSHSITPSVSGIKSGGLSSEDDGDYQQGMSKETMTVRIEELRAELDELKLRRQRTQHEISGMENLALRQRFQDILHTLNQDILYKQMEFQGLITLKNSDDI